MNYNRVVLSGNITREVELRKLPSGISVVQLSVAINNTWADKDGAKQESTDFIDVSVFSKQAENCAKYLVKGQNVLIEGKIKNRSWIDPTTSEKRYKTSVVADMVQFGQKPLGKTSDSQDAEKEPKTTTAGNVAPQNDTQKGFEYPTEDINPDDIPF